ncbi:RNA-binding protein [Microcoleus sp. FACHB-1515]|uniref:Jag family protein n=1 Tax=Cyanophyceae TaxID=3028117 RepID=UPI00168949C0|nr:R3H domain-containing nucleic acid-binding protein [Microcoleus sp. FACHB-1515]MBD2092624.1 RNA-binding protein [Microcoleus sp. FACHB-1515]
MDEQLQRGQQWLDEFLKLAGLPATVSIAPQPQWNEEWLTIDATHLTPDQVQHLTGDHGSALDAIQYLANTTLNLGRAKEEQQAITVELNGYRDRRLVELQSMAEAAAQQVRETGEDYELTSLSAAERRQVHTLLQAHEDLETFSQGTEPDRRLVVRRLQTS